MKTESKLLNLLRRPGSAVCRLPGGQTTWGLFHSPIQILTAAESAAVAETLHSVTAWLQRGGYAVGFISYAAAGAFDAAARAQKSSSFPAAWFALYQAPPVDFTAPPATLPELPQSGEPELDFQEYEQQLAVIKDELEQGNIYQVNFTFRTHAPAIKEPERFFLHLFNHHPAPYAAFVNTGELQIISNSPELFLEKNQHSLVSKPMKGTVRRHPLPDEDQQLAAWLARDSKNVAENLMITDMVRNDLGRICRAGSVVAEPLFKVDTYNTLHQMISVVHGELPPEVALTDILAATFPPASITGAPKISAMRLIADLEKSPRKLYTGTIGAFMPSGDFCLNVAIRTLINSAQGSELGVGGGIVYDSTAEAEWQEARLKSRFAGFVQPDFQLLETMLYRDGKISYLHEHLERLAISQHYFQRPWNRRQVLAAVKQQLPDGTVPYRLRLLLDRNGDAKLESYPLTAIGWPENRQTLAIAAQPTDSRDIFLYHKTTRRDFYNRWFAHAVANGFAEVVFFNERGELTEGAISSIFILHDGQWQTPVLTGGLLPGIWRQEMLKKLHAGETVIMLDDLLQAQQIVIGNSVRGALRIFDVNREPLLLP